MAFEKANYRYATHSIPNTLGSVIGNQALLNSIDTDKGSCIQLLKVIPMCYDGSYIEWKKEYGDIINEGGRAAKKKLEAAAFFLQSINSDKARAIYSAVNAVYGALDRCEIYPLKTSSAVDGLAAYNDYKISIKVGMDIYETAKTLIHEAFHIIGGCYNVKANPPQPWDIEPSCGREVTGDSAYKVLKGTDISKMSADHFAQYIMQLPILATPEEVGVSY